MRIVSAYLRVSLSKALGSASRPALKITRRRQQETPSIQHPLPREDHEPCASGLKIITAAFKRASSAPRVQLLEPYVPKVVWGNRLVSFVRTYARGLELKVPKVTNVWNVMFQRLLTFRTLCSKGRLGNSFVSRAYTRTHAHRKGTLSAVAILVQDEGSFVSLSSWISECRNV